MAAHRKRGSLVPLAAASGVLLAGAFGGYALLGNRAPKAVDFASPARAASQVHAASQPVTLTACVSSGQLTRVLATGAATCSAGSRPIHWAAQSDPAGGSARPATVTACLSSGHLTRFLTAAGAKCPAHSVPFSWPAQSGVAGVAGGWGRPVTVTACLSSGHLTRFLTAAGAKCPAYSVPFFWLAQSGAAPWPNPLPEQSSSAGPSPSSSSPGSPSSALPSSASDSQVTKSPDPGPTTTSPTPVHTTASPSPTQTSTSPGSWAWCSSAALGMHTTADGRFDLYNNEWNTSATPGPQTICGNSESDWQVTSTQRADNTEVLTYPSVQLNYNGTNGYPLTKFTAMTSSYTETMNAVSGTDAEAAYDIWINSLKKEVMIWVDNHGQTPAGSKVATTTFSGATWDLYVTSNRSYMAFVREGNAPSGTVDILAALNYLEGRGDLSGSDVLWQVNFGWEICSTAGAAETFTMSNYSLTSTPSS
jgi:hypothetical protein